MHKFYYDNNKEKLTPKPKPTVQPMNIPPESLQRLEKIMSSPRISPDPKDKLIIEITGYCSVWWYSNYNSKLSDGWCHACGKVLWYLSAKRNMTILLT